MVKRYIIIPSKKERFVVVGKSEDHLVFDNYCSCLNFQKNGLINKKYACKHILAIQQAKKKKKTEDFEITSGEYRALRKWFF